MKAPKPFDKTEILVVEDSITQAEYLKRLLEYKGYTVTVCFDALEAIEFLDRKTPDLIISDIMMPKIDGFGLCSYLQSTDLLDNIPVMMVTAMTELDNLEKAFAVGADDYIAKPVQEIELFARVRSLLEIKFERDLRIEREEKLIKLRKNLEEKNRLLEQLSYLDELTAVANRRCFDDIFEKEWKRTVRTKNSISIILIDIDQFKTFNDTYGHPAGDECLKHVARSVDSTLKRPADLIARFGGEEFIALLPNTDLKGALFIAEKMRENVFKLQIEHRKSNGIKFVTVSAGVGTMQPGQHDNAKELIRLADNRMYEAKKAGRNCVCPNG